MSSEIEQVSLFMALMGQAMPEKPTIPAPSIIGLRHELVREENNELRTAAEAKDIVEIADALCDLQYVVSGAIRAYGFSPEVFAKLFAEVQASNMSKICTSEEEAQETVAKYEAAGLNTYVKRVGEFFTVVRVEDDKVLKSINWREPDLRSILLKHGVKC